MDAKSMESAVRAKSARITDRLRNLGAERLGEWTAPMRRLQVARFSLDRFAAYLRYAKPEERTSAAAGAYARQR